MEEFETGAVRDCGGKGRMDLLPMCALIRVAKHMEDAIAVGPKTGKPHYPERNWEKGLPMHSMLDSGMRHLMKYMDGWDDEDHLCAAATNLLMAMWMEEKKPEQQDIPSRMALDAKKEPGGAPVESVRCEYYEKGRCLGTRGMDPCPHNGNARECTLCAQTVDGGRKNGQHC